MSLQTMVWATTLSGPSKCGIGDAAHLTLIALANYTDPKGRSAWPSQSTIAKDRGVTDRTIKRHFGELEDAGLMRRGDQMLVRHIPSNRRPIVWNLCQGRENDPDLGVTDVTPQESLPVDNSPIRGVTGVTPGPSWGDTQSGLGVTPGVLQTKNKPLIESTYSSTDRAVVGLEDHPGTDCIHGEEALTYHDKHKRERRPKCPECRQAGGIIIGRLVWEETANA